MEQKKVIIVTGGSRGIGAETVKALAMEGHSVILNYNKSEIEAKKIENDLIEKDCNIDIFKADVSNKDEVEKLVNFAIDKYKKIDVLINNAGISQIKLFTDISDEDWNNMINTNLNSVFYTTKAVLPNMIKNKSGLIINISSIWGITGASMEVHYSVSKAAIDGLTKSLAKEVGPSNIRINSIAPGFIDTDMNKELSEDEKNNFIEQIPLCRAGEPQDISKCILWMIEDEYTTGQIISINGGII